MKNKILSFAFIVLIVWMSFSAHFMDVFEGMISSVTKEISEHVVRSEWEKNIDDNPMFNVEPLNSRIATIVGESGKNLVDNCSLKSIMVEVFGETLKVAGNRGFYGDTDRSLNYTDDGYFIYRGDYTSTEYELDQIRRFKSFLDQRGIKFLYVNEPAKYVDDSYYLDQFGQQSFLNDNMDRFLMELEEENINYLDLRKCATEQGIDVKSQFYRTDHHWTVPTSKWAACEIIKELNKDYGMNLDETTYDDDRYEYTEFKSSWLGEQGRKTSKSYTGMEDYTVVRPKFDTSYTVLNSDESVTKATFNDFINTKVYTSTDSPYTGASWHYSYEIPYGSMLYNDNVSEGNLLVLGASYETCLLPFLSLDVNSIKFACLRDTDMTAEEIVESGEYDTVVMTYAQFMMGAHDRGDNPNYNMFNLCR